MQVSMTAPCLRHCAGWAGWWVGCCVCHREIQGGPWGKDRGLGMSVPCCLGELGVHEPSWKLNAC